MTKKKPERLNKILGEYRKQIREAIIKRQKKGRMIACGTVILGLAGTALGIILDKEYLRNMGPHVGLAGLAFAAGSEIAIRSRKRELERECPFHFYCSREETDIERPRSLSEEVCQGIEGDYTECLIYKDLRNKDEYLRLENMTPDRPENN